MALAEIHDQAQASRRLPKDAARDFCLDAASGWDGSLRVDNVVHSSGGTSALEGPIGLASSFGFHVLGGTSHAERVGCLRHPDAEN